MSQSKQALKSRIKSIDATRKITKAMEMIANAKLFKQRNRMEANREYARLLKEIADEAAAAGKDVECPYLTQNEDGGKLTIVYCSDMGLCGGYNQNIKSYAFANLKKEDPLIVAGKSLYNQFKKEGFNLLNKQPISSDGLDGQKIKRLAEFALNKYLDKEISGLQVIYTRFINTMRFEPAVANLLPFDLDEENVKKVNRTEEGYYVETLFEPDAVSILNALIPQMVTDAAYADWLESTTSEQGSRRMAMKTATDNADDLSQQLLLEYNKARQGAITQEITEIISGSSAV